MTWVKIAGAVLTPALISLLFPILEKKTQFGRWGYWKKQALIGIVFGIIACLATQFGVPYDGYVLNVRSAAPLTAGLVFGGPAGILAGVIGSLYRWFSVLWGIPGDTRIACTAATLLAGVLPALCRKFLFDGKKPFWIYGTLIAVFCEVLHMLLVFLTNADDLKKAFDIVQNTAVIMILANAVSVGLSLALFNRFTREKKSKKTRSDRQIAQTFAVYLLITVAVSFLATELFTSAFQGQLAKAEMERLLSVSVSDAVSDLQIGVDRELTEKAKTVASIVDTYFEMTAEGNPSDIPTEEVRNQLVFYRNLNGVSGLSLVGTDGTVSISDDPAFEGTDLTENPVTEALNARMKDRTDGGDTVFAVASESADPLGKGEKMRYAAVSIEYAEKYLLVGFGEEQYRAVLGNVLVGFAENRHIGQSGFLMILDLREGQAVGCSEGTVSEMEAEQYPILLTDAPTEDVFSFGEENGGLYGWASDYGDYRFVGAISVSEANYTRSVSVYISSFMLLLVFFILFTVVYLLLKTLIVRNVRKINASLGRITEGDLSEQIEVRENEEFNSLSDGINHTVSRLKELIADAEKRMDMELSLAKTIQYSVLPEVLPPIPLRDRADVAACMKTAKEVGGDFYDFYPAGENRIAFLIADVSGKGIPAAMFMMNAKSVLKNLTESGLGVAEIFTEANKRLCSANEAGMFVTAWMGLLDLKTGEVVFSNAGHNPPLIRRRDGSFTSLRTRPCFVLAGMEETVYREERVRLEAGDEILLYTDGVTEAADCEGHLFGEERLIGILNSRRLESARETCEAVSDAVDAFVGEAPQFDDITVLSLRFLGDSSENGGAGEKKITLPAKCEALDTLQDFLEAELNLAGCGEKAKRQIHVAADEIFANIARYAYPEGGEGEATVGIRIETNEAVLTFADAGIPFNPLAFEAPDVRSELADREPGGLGILLVKKTMDGAEYAREGGLNLLTLRKKLR